MRLSLILLFLQLWGDARAASSQDRTCSPPPVVDHAFVSEETQKDVYEMGDVIRYTCDVGYVSFPTTRYVCSNVGWQPLHEGKCSLKPCQLPDDIPHGYYEFINGDSFAFGATIRYYCNEGYHMVSKEDTRICRLDGWTSRVPVCDPLRCDPPPADRQLSVTGLPDNDEAILPDRFIQFSCDVPGTRLNGSSMLICGKNGQWDNPFPTCEEIACEPGERHSHLTGLPADEKVKVGQKLQLQCRAPYSLDGPEEIQCLPSGNWDSKFPTCVDICRVPHELPGLRIINHVPNNQLKVGQNLRLACRSSWLYLQGKDTIECSAGGRWRDPFPTCGAPVGCGGAPALEDGDTRGTSRSEYRHGERIEYACQNLYTMQGDPHRTCNNGEWTGRMKCLKPCTVNEEVRRSHNIEFQYSYEIKLYAPHNDFITFMCTRGTRHDRRVSMRQQCVDGVMNFPTCH